jgi:hypothetical protein
MGSCIRKFLRSPQWTGMQETGWQAARRERYPDVLSERDRRRDENV